MSARAEIYEEMRGSEVLSWVGGGDPEVVADLNFRLVESMVGFDAGWNVLDYGCGCGRAAPPCQFARVISSGSLTRPRLESGPWIFRSSIR